MSPSPFSDMNVKRNGKFRCSLGGWGRSSKGVLLRAHGPSPTQPHVSGGPDSPTCVTDWCPGPPDSGASNSCSTSLRHANEGLGERETLCLETMVYDLEKEPVSRKQVQRKWKQDKRTLDEASGRAGSSSGLSALGNRSWARPPALGGTWGSWVARGAMAGA